MKHIIRYVMAMLRILPQDRYSEEVQEINSITTAAMQSAKVTPVDHEEEQFKDEAGRNQVKDAAMVELFTFDNENHQGMSELEENQNYFRRNWLTDSTNLSEYDYHLRECSYDDYDYDLEADDDEGGLESAISSSVMSTQLFGNCELFDIVKDGNLIQKLHGIIFKEPLHGRKPNLPFNIESFLIYLFLQSRDLKLIRVMLRICQRFPIILSKYNQKLKASNTGTCVRNDLMLFFLVQVRNLDIVSARSTIQLMGFKNIIHLMKYYEDQMSDDPIIADSMYRLGYTINEHALGNLNNYGDIYEYDTVI
jgi:hypothetical protein